MNLILQRYSDNRDSTLGLMFKKITSGTETILHLMAYTLEDEFREAKVSKETRIPAGFYEVIINQSDTPKTLSYRKKYAPWFKYHLMLKNVPGFTGIYIHIGNTDGDSEGCILLGDSADNNTVSAGNVTSSTVAFQRFYKEVYGTLEAGGKVHIEVRDEKHLLK
jgi:hypothetical protein